MFWAVVGAVVVVVLALSWRYDRRHRIRAGGIRSSDFDAGAMQAKADISSRNISNLGRMDGGPGTGSL